MAAEAFSSHRRAMAVSWSRRASRRSLLAPHVWRGLRRAHLPPSQADVFLLASRRLACRQREHAPASLPVPGRACSWPGAKKTGARAPRRARPPAQTRSKCRTAPPAIGATAVVGGGPSIHPSIHPSIPPPAAFAAVLHPFVPGQMSWDTSPCPPRRAARQVPVERVEQGPLHAACSAEISPVPTARDVKAAIRSRRHPGRRRNPHSPRGRAAEKGDDRSVRPATPNRKRPSWTGRAEKHAAGAEAPAAPRPAVPKSSGPAEHQVASKPLEN